MAAPAIPRVDQAWLGASVSAEGFQRAGICGRRRLHISPRDISATPAAAGFYSNIEYGDLSEVDGAVTSTRGGMPSVSIAECCAAATRHTE
jgi:hypothetical protein